MSWGHHTGTVHDGTGRGHHADGGSPIDANSADGRDHSAHYLFLIIGTPLVAFLIAASAMFESRGLPIPLVRIGTGAAGLILQTIPFMLVGAMMSAAVSTFVSADALERHVPKSLAGGLAVAVVGGGGRSRTARATSPAAAVRDGAAVCGPGDEPDGDLVHVVRVHGQSMDGGGPRGPGHAGGERRGIVVRRPPVPLPRRTGPSADEGPDAGL